MIKFICDKCEADTSGDKIKRVIEKVYARDSRGNKLVGFPAAIHDLCEECHEKYEKLDIDIKNFMKMSEEEIELALYTFKVGDKVITDDGRIGTITGICTCEQCKKRGFYEPKVKLEVGLYDIHITNTDKNDGFRSFYKIGDQVFGNIDEECIERTKRSIADRKSEITCFEAQLNVINTLKNNLSDLNN